MNANTEVKTTTECLTGRIWWLGLAFGEKPGDEMTHILQDDAGKTVGITDSDLRECKGIHSRFSPEARAALGLSVESLGG